MKPIIFPYKTYKHVHYPIIPLEIQAGPIRRKTDAYVDSGASFSIFCIHEAKRLKLDYRKGEKILVTVGFGIALRANASFRSLLAAGLPIVLAVQTLLIIGGVLRMLPLTGITLPFASYGGSSLLVNVLIIALLARVSHEERT